MLTNRLLIKLNFNYHKGLNGIIYPFRYIYNIQLLLIQLIFVLLNQKKLLNFLFFLSFILPAQKTGALSFVKHDEVY